MRSDIIKKGFDKAPHRSLLRATGLKDEILTSLLSGLQIHTLTLFQDTFFFMNMEK